MKKRFLIFSLILASFLTISCQSPTCGIVPNLSNPNWKFVKEEKVFYLGGKLGSIMEYYSNGRAKWIAHLFVLKHIDLNDEYKEEYLIVFKSIYDKRYRV